MENAQIAQRIKILCKQKHKTIALMLSECNISKSLIYDMEKRSMSPSCDKIKKIADYLDCSVDYLLGRTDCPDLIIMDKDGKPTIIEVMAPPEKTYEIKIAARGGGISTATLSDSDIEKIDALPDVDDI